MKIHLLATSDMLPVPQDIKVLENWGEVTIIPGIDMNGPEMKISGKRSGSDVTGQHIYIEGEDEIVKKWLFSFPSFWLGKGSPMLQQFNEYVKE